MYKQNTRLQKENMTVWKEIFLGQ